MFINIFRKQAEGPFESPESLLQKAKNEASKVTYDEVVKKLDGLDKSNSNAFSKGKHSKDAKKELEAFQRVWNFIVDNFNKEGTYHSEDRSAITRSAFLQRYIELRQDMEQDVINLELSDTSEQPKNKLAHQSSEWLGRAEHNSRENHQTTLNSHQVHHSTPLPSKVPQMTRGANNASKSRGGKLQSTAAKKMNPPSNDKKSALPSPKAVDRKGKHDTAATSDGWKNISLIEKEEGDADETVAGAGTSAKAAAAPRNKGGEGGAFFMCPYCNGSGPVGNKQQIELGGGEILYFCKNCAEKTSFDCRCCDATSLRNDTLWNIIDKSGTPKFCCEKCKTQQEEQNKKTGNYFGDDDDDDDFFTSNRKSNPLGSSRINPISGKNFYSKSSMPFQQLDGGTPVLQYGGKLAVQRVEHAGKQKQTSLQDGKSATITKSRLQSLFGQHATKTAVSASAFAAAGRRTQQATFQRRNTHRGSKKHNDEGTNDNPILLDQSDEEEEKEADNRQQNKNDDQCDDAEGKVAAIQKKPSAAATAGIPKSDLAQLAAKRSSGIRPPSTDRIQSDGAELIGPRGPVENTSRSLPRRATRSMLSGGGTVVIASPAQQLGSLRCLMPPSGGPGSVEFTAGDYSRLGPHEFLNDTAIDYYVRHVQEELSRTRPEEAGRFYFFNSFFYKKLSEKSGGTVSPEMEQWFQGQKNTKPSELQALKNYEKVRKWTKDVDIFAKDYIIVPIHDHLHWSLMIICHPGAEKVSVPRKRLNTQFTKKEAATNEVDAVETLAIDIEQEQQKEDDNNNNNNNNNAKNKKDNNNNNNNAKNKKRGSSSDPRGMPTPEAFFIHLDSLGSGHQTSVPANLLRQYLENEWNAKILDPNTPSEYTPKMWSRVNPEKYKSFKTMTHRKPLVPRQDNHCDCGLFVCSFVEYFAAAAPPTLSVAALDALRSSYDRDWRDIWQRDIPGSNDMVDPTCTEQEAIHYVDDDGGGDDDALAGPASNADDELQDTSIKSPLPDSAKTYEYYPGLLTQHWFLPMNASSLRWEMSRMVLIQMGQAAGLLDVSGSSVTTGLSADQIAQQTVLHEELTGVIERQSEGHTYMTPSEWKSKAMVQKEARKKAKNKKEKGVAPASAAAAADVILSGAVSNEIVMTGDDVELLGSVKKEIKRKNVIYDDEDDDDGDGIKGKKSAEDEIMNLGIDGDEPQDVVGASEKNRKQRKPIAAHLREQIAQHALQSMSDKEALANRRKMSAEAAEKRQRAQVVQSMKTTAAAVVADEDDDENEIEEELLPDDNFQVMVGPSDSDDEQESGKKSASDDDGDDDDDDDKVIGDEKKAASPRKRKICSDVKSYPLHDAKNSESETSSNDDKAVKKTKRKQEDDASAHHAHQNADDDELDDFKEATLCGSDIRKDAEEEDQEEGIDMDGGDQEQQHKESDDVSPELSEELGKDPPAKKEKAIRDSSGSSESESDVDIDGDVAIVSRKEKRSSAMKQSTLTGWAGKKKGGKSSPKKSSGGRGRRNSRGGGSAGGSNRKGGSGGTDHGNKVMQITSHLKASQKQNMRRRTKKK